MPKFTGEARNLLKKIKPFGLSMIQTKKHTWIVDDEGKRLVVTSTIPSDRNAYKNALKMLEKLGHVPVGTKW
ncbi:hypothetical protein RCF27_09160 [Rhodococcus pyridinivorans]|uniref:hypothetical protein n=1 Tax=Rhodococcus pyridinivorans TaxID=103816 RepID=UPI00280BE769|nr:hypothetical protein [Rhodococcus pyridinivorans]WMM74427.1 hypothetical protein RCF27_09160 [Rhodococcus pyridinivorans]